MKQAIIDKLTEALEHPSSDQRALITRLADEILGIVARDATERSQEELVAELVPVLEAMARQPVAEMDSIVFADSPSGGLDGDMMMVEVKEPSTPPSSPQAESHGEEQTAASDTVLPTMVARHRGRGSYSIFRDNEEVVEGLSKAEAVSFNALSYAARREYLAAHHKE